MGSKTVFKRERSGRVGPLYRKFSKSLNKMVLFMRAALNIAEYSHLLADN